MKEKRVFFNPFRIISPKLNKEASRLEELYETPSQEMTCLEEGLLVMISKLLEISKLVYKSLILADPEKMEKCEELAREIHAEEKVLTGDLVCSPTTTGEILKTLVLFPGHLERAGDFLESVLNCARIKARDSIPFSDKAHAELTQLFDALTEVLTKFRDMVGTRERALLDELLAQEQKIAQMTLDFALTHEDRLLEGLCSPKASSLYLDILDSVRGANAHIMHLTETLIKLADSNEPVAGAA